MLKTQNVTVRFPTNKKCGHFSIMTTLFKMILKIISREYRYQLELLKNPNSHEFYFLENVYMAL